MLDLEAILHLLHLFTPKIRDIEEFDILYSYQS